MESELSRRSFIGAASVAALSAFALAGCKAEEPAAPAVDPEPQVTGPVAADETVETEILVVGLGASGLMAAAAAGKAGKKVLAIDLAAGFNGTGNINTTAPSIFGSKAQAEANPDNITTADEAYKFLLEQTHYQENSSLLRNMLNCSGICADTMVEAGMKFMFTNTLMPATASINDKTGAVYLLANEDRAVVWEQIVANCGFQTRFGLRGTELILDEAGEVAGVRCLEGEKVVDIKAKKVILCTGGFLANEDMVAEYFAGAKMLSCGDQNAKGDGIKMCLSKGGQMGKNYSVSMNEFGGANMKAQSGMRYVFGDLNCNGALRLAIMGLAMVDPEGKRFFDEGIVRDRGMFAGEPLIRNSTYYAVCDQAFIERVKTEPLSNLLAIAGKAAKEWKAIAAMTLTDIEADIDTAIAEGWAAKADTIADLAKAFDMPKLEATIAEYNKFCENGMDERFFTSPDALVPVTEGPFYLIQYNPSAWLSLGGIKTNDECQVVTAEGKTIANLYAAGADADLWAVPYVTKGSANGFCLASGWLAGQSAAAAL